MLAITKCLYPLVNVALTLEFTKKINSLMHFDFEIIFLTFQNSLSFFQFYFSVNEVWKMDLISSAFKSQNCQNKYSTYNRYGDLKMNKNESELIPWSRAWCPKSVLLTICRGDNVSWWQCCWQHAVSICPIDIVSFLSFWYSFKCILVTVFQVLCLGGTLDACAETEQIGEEARRELK